MKNDYTKYLDENNKLKNVYILHVLEMEIITYKVNTKYIVNKDQLIQLECISNNYLGFLRNIKPDELNTCKNGTIIATSKQHMEDLYDDYKKYLEAILIQNADRTVNLLINSIGGNKNNG